jgi:hypothetical protein
MKSRSSLQPNMSSIAQTKAVIDLPMYLVVTIIIGIIALGSVLSIMVLPSFYTSNPIVTVDPLIASINNSTSTITYYVQVHTQDHQPIEDAHVIIKHSSTINANTTNSSGQTTITIQPKIPQGLHENYLDVTVKASGYATMTNTKMLKVIL